MEPFKALAGLMQEMRSNVLESALFEGCLPLVYFASQENAGAYPSVVIQLDSVAPLPRSVPAFSFAFSVSLLTQEYEFATKAVDILLAAIDSSKVRFEGYSPNCLQLAYVGTNWEVGHDTFSVRAKIAYEGNMFFD